VVALAPFELDEEDLPGDSGSVPADADAVSAEPGPPEADSAPRGAPGALAQLADPAERAYAYAGRSKSGATIRAYASAGAIS
jgi:hypothetical protein